jgi:ribosome biogenesis GTPase A
MKLITRVDSLLQMILDAPVLANKGGKAWSYLQPIADFRQVLTRVRWHVTFFGAFKAGKSTVINAICGSAVLPIRNNRATGVVTKITYAPEKKVVVTTRHAQGSSNQITVPYESRAEYILLDVSSAIVRAPRGVEEVTVGLALPLLHPSYTLVDTPGIMDDAALTARSFRELERSDLVVMVLSASKPLSTREKDAIRHIHALVEGNMVFVLNRMDEVEDGEQAETISWVRVSLERMGIKQPRVYATRAQVVLREKERGRGSCVAERGLWELEQFLIHQRDTSAGEYMVLRSRLGILQSYLTQAYAYCAAELQAVQVKLEQLAQQEQRKLEANQSAWKKQIAEKQFQLMICKQQLPRCGEWFVNAYVAEIRRLMEEDTKWRDTKKLSDCFVPALQSYSANVTRIVRDAISPLDMTVPQFNLAQAQSGAEVKLPTDVAAVVGGVVGGIIGGLAIFIGPISAITGATIGVTTGRWISKKVFHVDAQRKALEVIEKGARNLVPTLTVEAEKYIDSVGKTLTEFGELNMPQAQLTTEQFSTQEDERYYREVVKWCREFQETITSIKKEIAI